MYVYIIIFLIAVLIYYYYRSRGGIPKNVFCGMMMFLGLFIGFGDMLGGYDRYIYGEIFDITSNQVKEGVSINNTMAPLYFATEKGYGYVNVIFSYITQNRYIFILGYTLVMYFFFYKTFIEETDNYGFALLLFFGLYFFFTFTYLRQALAVAIVGLSYRYIVRRKFLLYCIFMLFAFSLHNSSIIFFPMYFLSSRLPSRQIILLSALLCLGIGLTSIPSNLFEVYADVTDASYRTQSYIEDTSGFRFEYLLEAAAFLYFLISGYKRVTKDRRGILHFNIGLVFCCILLLFCKSLNGGRLAWPFILGLIFAVTPSIRTAQITKWNYLILPIMAFLLYFRVLTGWGVLLSPYKSFLTTGVREGDYIYYNYEYDHRYDYDKFYK